MSLRARSVVLLGAAGAFAVAALAQSAWQPGHAGIGFGQPPAKQWVQMISAPELTVNAAAARHGERPIPLRFMIQTGLHINSHAPHSRYLIPTTLKITPQAGVKIGPVNYPPGVDDHLEFSPNDALSVYTGEFGVMVPIRAAPGRYTFHGELRYQACDNRACNPPRRLPVTLFVTAR